MENYKILEQIGEVKYGYVYKCLSKRSNQIVAIKIIRSGQEGSKESFLQEIKYLQEFASCEGVIRLLETFEFEDAQDKIKRIVLVLEYADSDLTGLCDKGPKLELHHVKCLMFQILQAVANFHSRDLMHRDLKSANVLLHQGVVKIADFGTMTTINAKTHQDSNCCTLWYRAPELLLGKRKYGAEVDMWSIGCIFIELMTRYTPFPGVDINQQMDRIFKVTGTPTVQTWGPEIKDCQALPKSRFYPSSQLRTIFKGPVRVNLIFFKFLPNIVHI